jgi:ADP-ribose pyrophosphatase YjhB (NUDIX family)
MVDIDRYGSRLKDDVRIREVLPRVFCPFCAARLGALVGSRQDCPGCGRPFFHNAAPCVAVVVADGRRVLLARRGVEPARGKWDLPGGFCDAGEEPEEAVVRELREETGCMVEIVRFLGHVVDEYGDGGDHTLNCIYEARVAAGEPLPDDDVAELRWFDVDELPGPDELAFANTATALRRFTRWH